MGQTSPQACEKCPDFDRILNPGHNQLAVHVNITDCPPVEGIYIQHNLSVLDAILLVINIQTACAVRIMESHCIKLNGLEVAMCFGLLTSSPSLPAKPVEQGTKKSWHRVKSGGEKVGTKLRKRECL